MRISKSRISHAVMVRDREQSGNSYIKGLKRFALVEELSWYGVHTSIQSDLDVETLSEIYRIVIRRICARYGY